MPSRKLKAVAAVQVPQSQDDCAQQLRELGDQRRELERQQTLMNDEIAAVTARYQPSIEEMCTKVRATFAGVQGWCEANRHAITRQGEVKTANLVTGEVGWRANPPSCNVRGEDTVIAALKGRGMQEFVRVKETVNKEAVLSTCMAARTISDEEAARDQDKASVLNAARALINLTGLNVISGVEAFYAEPFEQKVAEAA